MIRFSNSTLVVLAVGWLALPALGGAAEPSAWDRAYDPATKTRFIPLELWTGGAWDGREAIEVSPADIRFGAHRNKRIKGPVDYLRPSTGETIQVYERTNDGKTQLFTLRADRTGLGRVADSRYPRDCIDESKFPLGRWTQGEKRVYSVPCNGGTKLRTIELTITKIDFNYRGKPHSLEFHWLVDGGREKGTNVTYTYSPGEGMTRVVGADD